LAVIDEGDHERAEEANMSAENPHLFRCPVCGEALIVFARGDQGPEIGCLYCLAANEADKVAEDGAGLIGGLLTVEQARYLGAQFRASGQPSDSLARLGRSQEISMEAGRAARAAA
jgi:hypothetical protein